MITTYQRNRIMERVATGQCNTTGIVPEDAKRTKKLISVETIAYNMEKANLVELVWQTLTEGLQWMLGEAIAVHSIGSRYGIGVGPEQNDCVVFDIAYSLNAEVSDGV